MPPICQNEASTTASIYRLMKEQSGKIHQPHTCLTKSQDDRSHIGWYTETHTSVYQSVNQSHVFIQGTIYQSFHKNIKQTY